MRIGVDIGGTFTDFVVFDEASGEVQTLKLLSTPYSPAEAALEGLELLHGDAPSTVVHGSTVATNAVLERKGARTALITTRGFRDILSIGRQARTEIFDFFADRPSPLVPPERCLEITERVEHDGHVLIPLDKSELPALVEALRSQDVESVAVSLLFSFLYPEHEQWLARSLRDVGFFVSPSSDILPEYREYERTSTTVVNAYVSPIVDRYISRLERQSSATEFRIMQSNGGSIRATEARTQGVRSILSGPAAGVVGALHIAKAADVGHVVTFDMGGTSTDVSLAHGKVQITTEAEIAGLPIRVPVVDVHTVGSGGGSIAYADDGGALRVGPLSAGANPGPVCYGLGGRQPTVTDANLVLGRLIPDYFLGGQLPLDSLAASEALAALAQAVNLPSRPGLTPAEAAALGVVQVVNVHMERALRVISVERGFDPRDFVLVSFGGAGGLHACDLARSLGIRQVLIPAGASTLSAFGMLAADVVRDYVQTVMLPGDTPFEEVQRRLDPLVERGLLDIRDEGISAEQTSLSRELDMRYKGQSYETTVPFSPSFVEDFHRAHQRSYGYSVTHSPVEIVNVRLRVVGAVEPPPMPMSRTGPPDPSRALGGHLRVVLGPPQHQSTSLREGKKGVVAEVPFYLGERLRPGHFIPGPANIVRKDTTIYLSPGEQATVDGHYNLLVEVS